MNNPFVKITKGASFADIIGNHDFTYNTISLYTKQSNDKNQKPEVYKYFITRLHHEVLDEIFNKFEDNTTIYSITSYDGVQTMTICKELVRPDNMAIYIKIYDKNFGSEIYQGFYYINSLGNFS